MTRALLDPMLLYLATAACAAALLNVLTVKRPFELRPVDLPPIGQLGAVALVGMLIAGISTGQWTGAALAALIGFATTLALARRLPRLTPGGAIEMSLQPLAVLFGTTWLILLLKEAGTHIAVLTFMAVASLMGAVLASLGFCEKLARHAMITHRLWRRPFRPLTDEAGDHRPKVSIHLCCYAEPPEIVIEVLDRLARMDYPDYEVLVCDNNTEDPALWEPLARHCERLNRAGSAPRFRFFHVAPLSGAKAGALNFCLKHTDPAAELIAVLDADYLPELDFLARLAGFFADPAIAYVQTPHDYRDFEASDYLRACYWEYMPNNKVELPSLNEYSASYTIGTMCIIRATALRRAGGWAEWCLTEDSEVSVRLRALGYDGVYVGDTFGRGLIPETFDDYKKQRFRWTAGPVQQLKRHWRLYLPGRLAEPSAIQGWSKLLEFQRGVAPLLQLQMILLWAGGVLIAPVLAEAGMLRPLDLPGLAWQALAIGWAAGLVNTWQRYRLAGCTRISDMLRGEIARMSLTYIQMVAGVAALTPRPLAWRRTPKFPAAATGLRALASTLPETAIGLGIIALLLLPPGSIATLGGDIVAAVALSGVMLSARFLAAPVMAFLGERDIAARQGSHPARDPSLDAITAEA